MAWCKLYLIVLFYACGTGWRFQLRITRADAVTGRGSWVLPGGAGYFDGWLHVMRCGAK